jgi:hypothetical protein
VTNRADGEITVLADRFEGKRLNSPNDVVVKSDDSIWFTDPPYGIVNNYNGSVENQELPMNVYRLDVDGNLWCGWSGGFSAGGPTNSVSDNFDGVMIFNKAGAPIGRIDLPERCANVCFGGYRRSRLFMAASRSLYSVWAGTSGAPGGCRPPISVSSSPKKFSATGRQAGRGTGCARCNNHLGPVPETRELVIPKVPFVVPYRVRDDGLKILRVFRYARRWPERL